MSTQPADPGASASGTQDSDAAQFTKPHRQAAAFVLLAANAVYLLLAFGDIFFVADAWVDGFTTRASGQFGAFVGFTAVLVPLLAVLLATHVRPVVSSARTIVVFAIVEYLASAVFGVIATLSGLIKNLSDDDYHAATMRETVEEFLARSALLALLLVAAMTVMRVYQGMYAVTSPSYGYGQQSGYPQQYAQAGYAQQAYSAQQAAGYPQGYAQQAAGYPQGQQAGYAQQAQAYAQQAQAGAGQSAAAGTQQAAGQGGYGYPAQQGGTYQAAPAQYPGYGVPQSQPEASSPFASYAAPASAPPAPASAPPGPASAPPASAYPVEAQFSGQPSSPVSAMPAADPDDRTHLIQPGTPGWTQADDVPPHWGQRR